MRKLKNILGNSKFLLLVLLVLNIVLFAKLNFFLPQLSGSNTLLDFEAYYKLLADIKVQLNPYSVDHLQTLGPPLVFLFYIPFSIFGEITARSLITITNLSAGIVSCYLLANKLFPKHKAVAFLSLTILLFSAFPTRFSIEIGQSGLPTMLLVTILVTSNSNKIKGTALALLISIKTFFLFSILALIRKKKTILSFTILYLSIFVLASLFFIKPDWYLYYFQNKFPNLLSKGSISINLNYYNQSLTNILYRLGIFNANQIIVIAVTILGAIVILLTQNLQLSIVLALLLSPISWQHYYVTLFPIFVDAFIKTKKSTMGVFVLLMALFFWWTEFPWLHQAETTLTNGLLASHYFLSGILLIIVILTSAKSKDT